MASKKFTEAAQNLSKAAEIAIESLKKFPPKEYDNDYYKYILKCCIERLFFINNPEPKYRNLRSLKYLEEEVFTRFQEGSGEDIEEFWKRIKEENLPFKRENKMAKILKRKKINNDIEYDFVTDVIVPYQQEGMITEEEVILLNTYLGNFENRKRK
ncbi:hypothetical protein GCM10022389_27590 [Flavobacterium cheonanense]|uniref:Uncharacterized protein n=1 Tax=Flavobacterium cheonanense TaxID=706183 RepID=A0ABP7W4J7_9FLAO